jgi:signal transduction histidine kinase
MSQRGTGSLSTAELLTHYEHLLEISLHLNSTLELSTLLRRIISAAEELTNTEAASILLLDPQTGDLRFEITSNLNPHETESIIIPTEGSTAGWIVRHGEPRVIEDVSQEPSHYQGVDDTVEFKTRNLLGVPMRTHDRVIGVLEALNKRDGARFNEHDIKTLTILAGQAAIAIENARLFQQNDFIAEMVHELRTPLVALRASTSLLLRSELDESRRSDTVKLMQGETERLIRMTSDFLDLARLESGRVRLEVEPFPIDRLIQESIAVVAPQANEKGVEFDLAAQSYTVRADRGKVKQVLLNLLTNAIKYNRPEGRIRIGLRQVPTSSTNQTACVEVSVADTGFGISTENQKNMFQKFYRVADTSGYTQGTGLGLAIAKHIIEAHEGRIWMESVPNEGSTFFFTLPTP